MSGGHWGYEDRKLRNLAEMLRMESEPVLAALGTLLEDVIDPLHAIDRVYSGDANPEQLNPALDKLKELILEASVSVSGAPGHDVNAVAAIRGAVMQQAESYRNYERSVTMQGGDGMVSASSVAEDLERNLLNEVMEAARKGISDRLASEGVDIDRIITEAVRLSRMPSYRPDETWLWRESEVVAEVKRLCLPPDRK
jgi:hypothetical protein